MTQLGRLGLMVLGLLVGARSATALDQQVEDLSASVEVAGVFSLSLTKAQLVFDRMTPGEGKILGEESSFNEITCRANAGQPWYLKAQLVSLKHVGQTTTLPASSLKWKVVEATGEGTPVGEGQTFQPFAEEPVLIYASVGQDNKGEPVTLKFQYQLVPPRDALAGSYVGQLVFTMVETP